MVHLLQCDVEQWFLKWRSVDQRWSTELWLPVREKP